MDKKGINKGDKNGMWKGDNVGYAGLHAWVKKWGKLPNGCEECGRTDVPLDLANISQEYKRDLNDWEWLCRRCHMQKDGRMKNLMVGKGPDWRPSYCKCGKEVVAKGVCMQQYDYLRGRSHTPCSGWRS